MASATAFSDRRTPPGSPFQLGRALTKACSVRPSPKRQPASLTGHTCDSHRDVVADLYYVLRSRPRSHIELVQRDQALNAVRDLNEDAERDQPGDAPTQSLGH